jgi:hypothetical protein
VKRIEMTNKPNQFRSLIAASGQAPVAQANSQVAVSEPPSNRRRLGKRTAPDYVQVGVYIPKQLHNQAKVLLIHEGADRDFSQLIGDLLHQYVNDQSTETLRN